MKLIHYAERHLDEMRSVLQKPTHGSCDKPLGLWVSVEGDDDWPAWCNAEEFSLERLACATEVNLSEDSSVLHIETATGLRDFHSRYVLPGDHEYGLSQGIDWQAVAHDYQGLIIAPYQWSCRLDHGMFWYYGWDCASGCIWSAEAVKDLRQLESIKAGV